MFAIYVGISTRETFVAQVHAMLRTHKAGFFFRMARAFSHSYGFPLIRYFPVYSSSEFLSVFSAAPARAKRLAQGDRRFLLPWVSFGSDGWKVS
jgi:hypothetical protein